MYIPLVMHLNESKAVENLLLRILDFHADLYNYRT